MTAARTSPRGSPGKRLDAVGGAAALRELVSALGELVSALGELISALGELVSALR